MVTKEGRSEATIEKRKWPLEKLRPIADTPIADLQAADLFAVLKKVEAQGHFETARRCLSFASRVFRYAAASGRADSDLLAHKISLHVMARPGELPLARWAEFDLEKAVWTVPRERVKMRRAHYVPLSRQVIALLESFGPTSAARITSFRRSTRGRGRSARIR